MSSFLMGEVEAYGSQLHLTPSDISYIESLRSHKRQAEVASWRDLLRRELNTSSDILYYPSGAPYIEGSDRYISVSHSARHVVVMSSASPCAIDIELLSRDFERVSSRYVTLSESKLLSGEAPLLPLLWSAKETLYKLSPLDGLDLLDDLSILSIDGAEICGVVTGVDSVVRMGCRLVDGHIVVWTL